MDVVVLNELLREDFAGVVKGLGAMRRARVTLVAAAEAEAKAKAAKAHANEKEPSTDGDATAKDASRPPLDVPPPPQFMTLAKSILRRLNAFGYTSRDQFRRDLTQLLAAASSPDETLVVSRLIKQQDEQLAASKQSDTDTRDSSSSSSSISDAAPSSVESPLLSGIKWQDAAATAAVTGLQRHGDGWRCNIRLGDCAIKTAVEAPSKADALRRYSAYCKGLTVAQLRRVATEAAHAQRRVDTEVLRDAMKQLRPRLPLHRVGDLASGRQDDSAKDKGREDVVELETPTASSASVSVVSTPSPAASAPSSPLLSVRSRRVSDAAIERRVQQRRQLPRMAMLRMRRLIQMRLCRHLEGAAVVARRGDEPEAEDDSGDDWTPTGRLERGRVVSLRDRQRMTLADFVVAELKSSVAACAHLFLVRSRQSIDDHLLECDEIDDALLDRLVVDFRGASESWQQQRRR